MCKAENCTEIEKINMDYLCVSVGQACNLRCRDCGNFAPYAPKDMMHYDVEEIIDKLNIITKYARIQTLQIQGGEPFLYPQLEILLDYVRKSQEIKQCLVATNGTVLPKVKPEYLQGEKFLVRISHYPVNSDNAAKVQKWFRLNSIRYKIYHFVSEEDKWFDLGRKYNPGEDVESRFENCLFKNCYTFENGWIERCARALVAQRIMGFKPKNFGGGV